MVSQLLTQIDYCLRGLITLRHLEEWLLSHLQDILSSGDKKAIELANRVDADLVELSEKVIDEPTTYEHLQKYLRDSQTEFTRYGRADEEQTLVTSNQSVTVKTPFLWKGKAGATGP